MTRKCLYSEFIDADLRMESVVCLALMPADALSESATSMLECVNDVIEETGIEASELDEYALDDLEYVAATLTEELHFNGFFVNVSKPADEEHKWGCYKSHWFYAQTVETAIRNAIDFYSKKEQKQ